MGAVSCTKGQSSPVHDPPIRDTRWVMVRGGNSIYNHSDLAKSIPNSWARVRFRVRVRFLRIRLFHLPLRAIERRENEWTFRRA